ncbi:MAG TPA: PilN domain-containing protein [Burkholderiales bacterium]|nr:PilN domain-containing protein [Burkholderiales bacterium]
MSQQLNLFNPLFEKKPKPFSVRTLAQALAAIAVGVVALSFYAVVETRSVERAAEQLRAQISTQREQVTKLAKVPVQTASKVLEAEVARLESEVKARQTSLQAISTGELGNTAGFSEFFAALGRQAVPGLWLTTVTVAESGGQLTVQGRALRADLMPAFLRALTNEPIMRGRKVTEMKLTAVAPPPADKSAKPDAEPQAFIEFSLSAPLQVAEVAATPAGTP